MIHVNTYMGVYVYTCRVQHNLSQSKHAMYMYMYMHMVSVQYAPQYIGRAQIPMN